MSSTPTSRSADLRRLRDEGYHLEIHPDPIHLVVHDVPYVNERQQVKRGQVISTLALDGDVTTIPETHVVMFTGEVPCDQHGAPLAKIINESATRSLGPGLEINHTFSSKPPEGYPDYHAKMTAYIDILEGHAQAIDPTATARTFPVIEVDGHTGPFRYYDTATSRVGIGEVTAKLNGLRIGIAGLGGSGGYVFDQVAKTPVAEIHPYDGDRLQQHSAFRAPGAVPKEKLNGSKVDYFADIYEQLHTGIVRHPVFISETNVAELGHLDFVFICVDDACTRKLIVEQLERDDVPFIDLGMGLEARDGALNGIVRATTSTPGMRDAARRFLPLEPVDVANDYVHNIQVADLNMLNAALAVIRWKKWAGFYADFEGEHHTSFTIDGNRLISEGGRDVA